MNIQVTPTAAEKISELLAEENKTDAGLRVFVQGSTRERVTRRQIP